MPERNVEEWIDPAKWPQYLMGVLRSVSEEISLLKQAISNIRDSALMDRSSVDEKIREIVRDEMKIHEEHHRLNEPRWSADPWKWVKRWWWGVAILVGIALVLFGHYTGAPYREILKEFKMLKDAGLIK